MALSDLILTQNTLEETIVNISSDHNYCKAQSPPENNAAKFVLEEEKNESNTVITSEVSPSELVRNEKEMQQS